MAEAAPKQANPVVVLHNYLQERISTFKSALPPHLKPDRFIASVMTAVQLNQDLLACDRRSLFMACVRAAQDGLLPDGTEAAIVPLKDKAQYLVMYQGLMKKFRNSGEFRWVTAGLVREGEIYEHWITEQGEHFKHIPGDDSDAPVRRVYALATTKDGGSFVADLSVKEINKRRAMSRATRDDAPWKQWPEEMQKKTALRVLSKLLPKSSDIDAFLQRDEAESLGVQATDTISDPRGAVVGNVFDHFAETKSEPAASVSSAAAEASPQQGASGAGQSDAAVSSAGPAPPSTDPAEVARRRGREGYRAGKKRREVPEEYRAPGSGALALNWTEGWDAEQAEEQRR
jgi:recombination protein RecT